MCAHLNVAQVPDIDFKTTNLFCIWEVSINPMTLVWTFLKSYYDCASFGGGLAHFRCVLAEMCGFENLVIVTPR